MDNIDFVSCERALNMVLHFGLTRSWGGSI